jgi:hypothetical protein
MEELTKNEIQRNILAAYDSVILINELLELETVTAEEQDRIDRNKEHLKVMLEKEWFADALTEEQKQELIAISK